MTVLNGEERSETVALESLKQISTDRGTGMASQKDSPKAETMAEKISDLRAKRARTGTRRRQGSHRQAARQSGKLSARERVARLVDKDSFEEIGLFARHRATYFGMADKELPADGVVTGCATIDGRLVHLASQDFTVVGGAAGETHSNKVAEMMGMSLKTGSPFIFINDSGGARVQEGIDSLAGYARVFYNNVMLSGTVPQISLICGPCAGGAAYSPALTDFVIQTQQGRMFITGPQVIKQVTGEVVSAEELGGPQSQMNNSGVVHLIAQDDDEALQLCRRLLSFMPSNNLEDPPRMPFSAKLKSDSDMNGVVPVDPKIAYDVRGVVCARCGQPGFSRDSAGVRGQHRDRLRPPAGPAGGDRGQPAMRSGRRARHRRLRQVGALCPLLQCVQHSAAHLCRCAGLSAWSGAGARRHYSPRRQVAVCLLGRRRFRRSRWCCARPTAERTSPCAPRAWARTGWWRGPRPRLR